MQEKIRTFTSPYNIKGWLNKSYTYTDKLTFISIIDLYYEYDYYIDNNEISINFNTREKWETTYYNFWRNLRLALKELDWPIEENYLYYNDNIVSISELPENCEKVQGIYFLLKLKDKNTDIIELPKTRIITPAYTMSYSIVREGSEIIRPFYFNDYKLEQQLYNDKKIDALMKGFPETIVHPPNNFAYYQWEKTFKNPINLKNKNKLCH